MLTETHKPASKHRRAQVRSAPAQTVPSEHNRGLASREGLLAHAWIDRDLSWLEFNRRVLHEAQEERTPLLERVKFLAIVASNLDEFFMKRVGLLRGAARVEADAGQVTHPGDTRERLKAIRTAVLGMLADQAHCYRMLVPALAEHGIALAGWDQLTAAQKEEATRYFERNVSPSLTPLSLDSTHPFPFMSNLSTNWGFILRDPHTTELVPVRVKIPTMLPQWIPLTADLGARERTYLRLEELIRYSAERLFPGMEIVDASLFRILRNAEVEVDEEDNDSLREAITEALRQRRFEPVVRVDFAPSPNLRVRQALVDRFELTDEELYELPELLDYTSLFQIAALDLPALRDPPWTPMPPLRLPTGNVDVFEAIRAGDLLLHHPYDSFELSVEHFISEAAADPQTVAIKMTVYRIGDDTPFVRSLIRAAEAGKQVACVIELKARFDESRNLHWAQELEKVGAHVTYGVLGLKTHTKVALVVRQERHGLRCYAHIATGNYHVKTAKLYTDVGLLTCDPVLTDDVVSLFHHLTGRSRAPTFQKLLVAPINMRQRFLQLIEREVEHHQSGRPARIIAKMNQVEDLEIARALSAASQAGVPVDLIVRGFCCLAPGVPGWTEKVRVRSIIGRFLEHSRIIHFANGQQDPLAGEFFIGSADWMSRNLSRRIEAATPVEDGPSRERLWEILNICLQDRRQAWEMQSDGAYIRLVPPEGATGPAAVGTHDWLMELNRRRAG